MAYTQHHLNWEGPSPTVEEVAARAAELFEAAAPGTREHENETKCWTDTLTGNNICKWYEHELQMARLSREWPGAVFELSGSGEDETDLWKKYFRNGQIHTAIAEITYQPFNPEMLRDPWQPQDDWI